jgi:anthranilate synthase component 1
VKLVPSLGEVRALAGPGRLVPVYAELLADLETPVSAYVKLAAGESYSFLLESVEGGERLGRFSFIGIRPRQVLTIAGEDPLPVLAKVLGRRELVRLPGLPRFVGGAIGYLAYDVVRFYEPRVPLPEVDVLGLPEAVFMVADTVLVFDHLKHRMIALTLVDG